MDKPGKVINPARGQLNGKNDYFPVPVRAWEFGLATQVRPTCPASPCSFYTLRLNLVLTHEIPPPSSSYRRVTGRHVMRQFTSNGTDQSQNKPPYSVSRAVSIDSIVSTHGQSS